MATLRGVLRSLEASARRAERESLRRQKEYNKMMEYERSSYEVEQHENQIAVLQSMHQDCSEKINWNQIINLEPPIQPIRNNEYEQLAKNKFDKYKPTIFHKLFGRVARIKEILRADIQLGIHKDDEKFLADLLQFEKEKVEWAEDIKIASSVIEGNLEGYKEAVTKINPFTELSNLGIGLSIFFPNKDLVVVNLNVHSEDIIPSVTKTLLKSGKVSVKSMPISRFNEIYQDHVCSSILRVARETFAVLPVNKVIVTAFSNIVNTRSGYKEDTPILSVLIPIQTLNMLNFNNIDPSDCMKNFVHNMDFKKSQGFNAVEKIRYEQYA